VARDPLPPAELAELAELLAELAELLVELAELLAELVARRRSRKASPLCVR
jgi:hypothetical protein